MGKLDLKRTMPTYAARRGASDLVSVPPLRYLMINGQGDPKTATAYVDALATLYPVAYVLKFRSKTAGQDYVVPSLEALWWAEDMAAFTAARDKNLWRWTAMILVPDWLDENDVAAATDHVRTAQHARGGLPPRLDDLRSEVLEERLCVQTLHVGPYDDEGPVLAQIHEQFIPQRGLRMTGRHHEIYLGDPRRTAPQRLRTILRHPVAYAARPTPEQLRGCRWRSSACGAPARRRPTAAGRPR